MQNINLEQLHTKLRQHLENQKNGWKSFVYAKDKQLYQGFSKKPIFYLNIFLYNIYGHKILGIMLFSSCYDVPPVTYTFV